MNSLKILGIRIDDIRKEELLSIVGEAPKGDKQIKISTLNPEILLEAHDNEEYYFVLGRFDIAVADGFGLKLAALTYGRSLNRITGADLVVDLFRIAAERDYKIGIVIREGGLSSTQDVASYLQNTYPSLRFKICSIDHEHFKDADLSELEDFAPDFLLNTLGAPFQEKFIYFRLEEFPSAKIAIGVGGALDFLTGKIKRAPLWMRKIGIEWFWRMMIDPRRRAKRIFNAVFVYSAKFLVWRYILPFFYRPNVACLLYKETDEGIKVLILKRRESHNHWQIPQGGKDGEATELAGRRELNEEVGTDDFKTVKVFKNVHRYIFRYNIVKRYDGRHGGYKGQKQDLYIAEFTGNDSEIKLNYWDHVDWRWENLNKLVDSVHEDRKVAMEKFIAKLQSLNKKASSKEA